MLIAYDYTRQTATAHLLTAKNRLHHKMTKKMYKIETPKPIIGTFTIWGALGEFISSEPINIHETKMVIGHGMSAKKFKELRL